MQHQANPNHFEFLGLDVIADREGGVWLMEGESLVMLLLQLGVTGFVSW